MVEESGCHYFYDTSRSLPVLQALRRRRYCLEDSALQRAFTCAGHYLLRRSRRHHFR